ncbi:helix-turn-helix domain-containing protein [Rufibacter soli]
MPRIKEILDWCGLGPAAFADEIGVARPVISHVVSARNKASLEVVQKILTRYPDLSPAWLLLGEGQMLKGLEQEPVVISGSDGVSESPIEEEKAPKQKEKVQEGKKGSASLDQASSVDGKQLVKVILLYSDGSFENFSQG